MPDLVVNATLFQHSPNHFIVIVSTASAAGATETRTDLRIEDARTEEEALRTRSRLVGEVVDRAERRGDHVQRVIWKGLGAAREASTDGTTS